MDTLVTLVDISEEDETQVDGNESSKPVPAEPISPQPTLPFLFPIVTPWPLPLPPQHPGLRQAAEQANAGIFFTLWDSLTRTELCEVSEDSPPVFSIITVDDEAWTKQAQHGKTLM